MNANSDENPLRRAIAVAAILGVIAVGATAYFFMSRTTVDESVEEIASLPPLIATQIHSGLDYVLDHVATAKTAPALFIDSIDVNLERIRDVGEKKSTFFRIMLPHIARENDRIRAERDKILATPDKAPVALYKKYGVEEGDVDELLHRVDIVPASLVLAQAALESGWGTSRFARQGNNFFGMRTYRQDADGMDPKQADGFKVMKFDSIGASVRAYMKNLNTNVAYKAFRRARAEQRAEGHAPRGRQLTQYLTSYSEIPETYGTHLRRLMNRNRLNRFDGVRLAKE